MHNCPSALQDVPCSAPGMRRSPGARDGSLYDQDDALFGKLRPRVSGLCTAAKQESAAVYPYHDWQFCIIRSPGRIPYVKKQAIF